MILQKGDIAGWKVWQTFLNTRGFTLDIDGDPGPKTRAAIKLWQSRATVPQTGEVDDATIDAAKILGFKGFGTVLTVIAKVVVEPSASHLAVFTGSRIDQINGAHLARVSPTLQRRGRLFIEAAAADGVIVQIVQGLRTFAEQDALFRKRPKVTNAVGGQSLHNYGLALDFAPVVKIISQKTGKEVETVSWDEKLYKPFGAWADAAGLEWGGRWRKFVDLPHVQDDEDMSLKQIQQLYRTGGLAAIWAVIK